MPLLSSKDSNGVAIQEMADAVIASCEETGIKAVLVFMDDVGELTLLTNVVKNTIPAAFRRIANLLSTNKLKRHSRKLKFDVREN